LADVYLDTSALAKWYINEDGSEQVEEYLRHTCPVHISLLTIVEMRSLTAGRGRQAGLDAETQARVIATFDGDVAGGHLVLLPHTAESFLLAESLLGSHPELPLRTLDALHLGVMRSAGVGTLATADRVMARAAATLGMQCRAFL
jgi:predicted nucleic acid-binding protein